MIDVCDHADAVVAAACYDGMLRGGLWAVGVFGLALLVAWLAVWTKGGE